MSLMKLLTAGKSWVSGKDGVVQYRAVDPRALPKFGSDKNPFRSTARAGDVPVTASVAVEQKILAEQQEQKQPVGARTAPVRRSQESMTTSALLPDRCQPPVARAGTVRAPDEPEVSGFGTWWKKLAALVPRSQRQTGGSPRKKAEPDTLRNRPTQGELSLDKVQVMTNDLSYAYLEVVPCAKEKAVVKKTTVAKGLNVPAEEKVRAPKALEPANQVTVGRS